MTALLDVPVPIPTAYISFIGPIVEQNVESLIARVNVEVQQGAQRIHLLMSSYGGEAASGFTAYSLLKGVPVELITHNTGNVGSAAIIAFLAGRVRYSTASATFYFHGTTGSRQNANAAALQSAIEGITLDNARTVDVITKETGMPADEARALLSSVGETRDATSALACGVIQEVRDVTIAEGGTFYQLILQHYPIH